MSTYLLYNAALGQFTQGHKTTDLARALRWLHKCRSFVQVVQDRPRKVIAIGGDVCSTYGCGAFLSAHEKTTADGSCFGCRADARKDGAAC